MVSVTGCTCSDWYDLWLCVDLQLAKAEADQQALQAEIDEIKISIALFSATAEDVNALEEANEELTLQLEDMTTKHADLEMALEEVRGVCVCVGFRGASKAVKPNITCLCVAADAQCWR